MGRFETKFLDDYSGEAVLAEIRRIASQHSGNSLSIKTFVIRSQRVSSNTIRRRFSDWKNALERAGFGHLYSGQPVSQKMRVQAAKRLSDDDLIAEMKRVLDSVGRQTLTTVDFAHNSKIAGSGAIRNRFGSWEKALEAAGIPQSQMGRKSRTEEECFENLAAIWTQSGRQPTYREMFSSPSTITGKVYVGRWGTWRKALRAFVTWANSDQESGLGLRKEAEVENSAHRAMVPARRKSEEERRDISPRLRFRVFKRDRFRCVACGRSPATHLNIVLHADHINPCALSVKTVMENLQTLCQDCNLGKGTLPG